MAPMSWSGLPGTAIRSASLPFSKRPASTPRSSASVSVALCSTCAGVRPHPTSQTSCCGLVFPCGPTPASVPKAMRTPAFCASRIICGHALPAASALATMAGGNFFSSSAGGPFGSYTGPGMRKTPFFFIKASVSGLRKVPCSMESTPAWMAIFAGRSPWQCAAALRPQACASCTMASISACVSCGLSTGSASESTPPEAMNLITEAPYLICQRTAARHSSAPLQMPCSTP